MPKEETFIPYQAMHSFIPPAIPKAVSTRDMENLFSLGQPLAFWQLLLDTMLVFFQAYGILSIPGKTSRRIASGNKIVQSGFQVFYCDVQQVQPTHSLQVVSGRDLISPS